MDKVFVLRVLLSFFIAGGWIALTSVLAEKFGSKIGGLISNLPSNILVSLVFISIVNDVSYLAELIPGIPIGLIIDTIFLLVFVILLRYNLVLSVIISLLVWFILAYVLAKLEFNNLIVNILVYVLITALSLWFIERIVKIPSKDSKIRSFSAFQIIYRAAFGGSIVATIVVFSTIFNPFFTGIFSTFPAMILSTLIILTISQGNEFTRAAGKVLILSTTNIIVYAIMVGYTYPRYGILIGTVF